MSPFESSPTDKLVKELKDSFLFAVDFPQRKHLTHTEWAAASEFQRNELDLPKLAAIRSGKSFDVVEDIVKQLGDPKHASAVPVLAHLWRTCALETVRVAVGRSLNKIGTKEAYAALIEQIEDADRLSCSMAVRALFEQDPSQAFERCCNYFLPERLIQPGNEVIPNAILRTLAPGGFNLYGPVFTDSQSQGWLKGDRRWLDLCARLRKSKQLGDSARNVLRSADAEMVKDALNKVIEQEIPHVINVVTKTGGDLFTRYQQGQHEVVWKELREYESVGGDLLEEATAIANETMKRVARNADLLAERLASHGWKPLYGSLRTPPLAEDGEVIARIEEITGAMLPVSLRAFWEIVGGINFVWDYDEEAPAIGDDLVMEDPLCIYCPQEVAEQMNEWGYGRSNVDPEIWDPISLYLAPDYLHKASISGGDAYAIILPYSGVDPIFANEEHNLPFVDYLRLCFKWGGFPRLERYPDRSPNTRSFLTAMTKDLEPF